MHRPRVIFFLIFFASAALRAANFPFPQNQAQPNTAYYPAYSNADMVSVYNSWKTQQVTASGAGGFRRVQRNGDPTLQANSTVSEGIGYGMIIAVYMNDQALFDDLWRYYNLHLDGNGLMNWYISADGATTLGSGGASDADQDAAWALCMAIYQWGTSTYGPTYSSLAQALITKLYNVYVDPTTKAISPWGGAGNNFNISYFDPAEYRVFAQVSGNSGWLNVVEGCYTVMQASLNAANANASNGLVPAWSNSAGVPVPGFAGAPTHFQYDSCRTPFRFIKDWYFFGEPRALSYAAKINSFYGPIGADHITDGYDLNGAPRPQYDTGGTGATGQSAAFVSPAMASSMAFSANSAFTQLAYDRVKTNTLLIGGPYYDQCWTVMGMLMASGNYLNYLPTPTPTPTPDACQTVLKVNVGGPATAGYSADKVWSTGSWGYLAAQAGTVATSAGPITGANPALYLDERYGTDVRYRFSGLANGSATVTLQFAETYFSSAGQRQFDVSLNGTLVENNLDLYVAAGGQNKALVRSYVVSVTANQIDLILTAAINNATLQAIVVQSGPLCTATASPTRTPNWTATITPTRTPSPSASPTFSPSPTRSPSATISPTFTALPTPDACTIVRRINAGGTAFTDSAGDVWAADQAYSAGGYGYVSFAAGTYGTSAGPISGTLDDALYTGERYGNPVRYRFDVPNGAYRVRALLAETYFASAGQRSISVVANGVTVVNNVDLFTAAGGMNAAWELTFTATAAAGQLYIEASSSNNNGTLMGLELISAAGCTPTITRTFTPNPATNTPSPTGTSSATSSASPSATASRTPTASGTATPTRSSTATATLSSTPSQTPSHSPTSSATSSASPTRSATLSATSSGTPTRTVTLSASPSSSVTPSITPTPSSSGTQTPGPSPTFTVTPSRTRTQTQSATPSATLTDSLTPTPSSSATPSLSPTLTRTSSATPTITMTFSVTDTITPGPSPTQTPTGTISPTSSNSPSATGTATPSMTPSSTETATSTVTVTGTGTVTSTMTLSPTPSASATVAVVGTLTWTSTPTPSLTPSPPAGSSSPGPTGQPVEILALVGVPNPNPRRLAILARGGPGEVELRLFSSAMTCLAQERLSVHAGWNFCPSALALGVQANGLYYVEVTNGTAKKAARVAKLSVLR